MRARKLVTAVAVAATCAAVSLAGCVDLFHSTDFGGAAATTDAASSESGIDAAPQDICLPPAEALAKAKRSCALLSACESPVGDNAIGRCLPNAIVAYDCTVSPLRPTGGAALAYWSCLAQATTCEQVHACIYPQDVAPCPATGAFTACPIASSRADCETAGAKPPSETCAATGRVCTANGMSEAYCTGTGGLDCTGARCDGTQLHACLGPGAITLPDGGKGTLDEGFDCASYGGGTCVQNTITASCKPASDTTCAASADVTCDRNVAVGCPSGFEERVDCAALTGRNNTCTPTSGGRAWDVSRACGIPATDGGSGCARDTCSGEKLVACVRGAQVTIDCAADANLARCIQVRTFDGERPTCSRP
ncbi:MAG: hypothetical protein JWM74_1158 [Myxococcaceae bacterium]|nr:hypothetical protein [Myxococcaceae bacterium]